MAMREQLLQRQLTESANSASKVMDQHETAAPYRRWPLGLRTLLRLRYLDIKKLVLNENRQALRYDTDHEEIQQEVLNKIRPLSGPRSIWSLLLRSWVFYPLLIAAIALAGYFLYNRHQAALERSLFINDLPRYGDLVYQLKAIGSLPTDDAQASQTEDLQKEIDELQEKILQHFESYPGINETMLPVLDAVQRNDSMQPEVIGYTKLLNDQLFSNGIPYYVSVMSEIADCLHLPVESFLPRLFGGGEHSDETCVVHALLSFHVDEFRYYADGEVDHLAYFTRRIDGLEIYEGNVLGKVHIGDNTAQILLGNIEGASQDSLTAVNNGQLQSRLMPQGMPDVYGLESIARRLQSTVLEQYTAEFEKSWRWRLDRVRHRLTGAKSGLLLAATERLQRRTADVTAFHEVQHLIDQHQDLQEPDWFQDMLLSIGDSVPTNEAFQRHVLWELSAFFTHFAYGAELNGILLNEFTGITLDPMLQDQPHYYSIRILLPVLHAMYDGTLADTLPEPASTLGDVARSYKLLATHTDELETLARDAYRILFGQDIADIRELMLKSNAIKAPVKFK